MLRCMSVCCGVLKGLSSHDCKGQIAQPLDKLSPYFPIPQRSSSSTLFMSSRHARTHAHTHTNASAGSSPSSCPRCWWVLTRQALSHRWSSWCWQFCGPLRITRSLGFGAVGPNWTVTFLRLWVFVKTRSQEVWLCCQELSHTISWMYGMHWIFR